MSRLAAFSKYLTYGVGGAEKSTFSLLADRAAAGDSIHLIGAADARFVGRAMAQSQVPASWTVTQLEGLAQFPRFGYLEYLMNRAHLARWFAGLDANELWTYGLWAPAAMQGFRGRIRFFVRSETDIGVVGNYFAGVRKAFKGAYNLIESPATAAYRRDLRRAVRHAEVTANSCFMARRVREELDVDSDVLYPPVNVAPIKAALESAAARETRRWIVFVGDNVYKGLPLVCELARRLPNLHFRIFSRFVDRPREEANVYWMPWQRDAWRVYEQVRLVIVPSQWEEAYGRAAREAFLLGLPVLASHVGGLPEAVEYREDCLVREFRSVDAWEHAIRRTLLDN